MPAGQAAIELNRACGPRWRTRKETDTHGGEDVRTSRLHAARTPGDVHEADRNAGVDPARKRAEIEGDPQRSGLVLRKPQDTISMDGRMGRPMQVGYNYFLK